MRRREVQRVSRTVAAALVAAAVLFAWVMSRGGTDAALDTPAKGGARAFSTHCAACHDVDDLVAPIRVASDPQTALAAVEAFLATHGDSSSEDDRRIREYFASRIER